MVESSKIVDRRAGAQPRGHPVATEFAVEIAQRLVELLLSRDALGQVELAADAVVGIEQGHRVTALRRDAGACEPGRPCADDGDAPGGDGRQVVQLGLVAGAGIDQTGRELVFEDMVQASLIAGDAGVDRIRPAVTGLGHPGGVGQQRTRHRHHVRLATCQDPLGDRRHVDAVGGDQRHLDVRLQPRGDAGERAARHAGRNGGDARFVPTDAGVDQRRAGRLDRLRLGDDLVPRQAVVHQINHRQAIDKNEIGPAGLADAPHDFDGEPAASRRIAPPGVVAPVGPRRCELVDQVALGAHDLDAVIARVPGQPGAVDERGDLSADPEGAERTRREWVDGRLQPRGCDLQRVVAIPSGVQQLQADPAAMCMHGPRHLPVLGDFPRPAELAAERLEPAGDVGGEPAGHDEADAACGAFGEICRQLGKIRRAVFQAGVHRAHQHPVGQRAETEVQG